LKSIETIRERNNFRIDWERSSEKTYLAEHEYLLWQLRHCSNFVDERFAPIRFTEEGAALILSIEAGKGLLESKIVLKHKGDLLRNIQLLTENHAFVNRTVFRIQPLGENFRDLRLFEGKILPMDLEKFLSLLYSYFENITVKHGDYRQIEGPPRRTRPTLIFENVDTDHSLYLRVSNSLDGFDPDFLENYDVTRIALLNDLEKTLVVSDVLHEDLYASFDEIDELLRKNKRKLQKGSEYYIEDTLFIIEESPAKEFIYRELPQILTHFTVFGAEKLKSYKVRAVTPKLSLSLSHGIDFLEGNADLDIEGRSISLLDALSHYHKHSYIPLNDGTHAVIKPFWLREPIY